jgi:hypothetical protein
METRCTGVSKTAAGAAETAITTGLMLMDLLIGYLKIL